MELDEAQRLADYIRDRLPDGFTVRAEMFEGEPMIFVTDPDGVWGGSSGSVESIISSAEDMVSEYTTDPFTIALP